MRPSCSAIWNCQSSRCRIRLSWYESARWKLSALLGTDDKSLTTGYIPVSDPTPQSHLYKATERTPTDRPPPRLSQAVTHLSPAHSSPYITPILMVIPFTRILVVILDFKDLKKKNHNQHPFMDIFIYRRLVSAHSLGRHQKVNTYRNY